MKLFKNKVGRPSNETLRKRRIIKISLLLVCIALIMTILLKTNILSRLKGEASSGNYTLSVEKFVNLENKIDFSYETSYGYVVAEKISDKNYKLTKYDQNLEQLGDSKTLSGISIDESTIKTNDDGFASHYDGKINIFDNNFDSNQSFVVDSMNNMLQSNDGNYLIVSQNYIDDKNTQIMIKKYNLNGEVLLNKTYDVNDENGVDDFAIILKEDNDSNIVLGIRYYTNNGEFIPKILKYDVNGNILIDKVINDSNLSNKDALMNIDIDSNGNYLLIFNGTNEFHSNIVCINKNTGEIINNNSFDSVFIKSNSKKNSNNHVFSGGTINDGFLRNSVLETDSNNNIVFNLIDKDNDGGLANVYYQNANKYILIGNTKSGGTGFLAVYNISIKSQEDEKDDTPVNPDDSNSRLETKTSEISEKVVSKVELDDGYALIIDKLEEVNYYKYSFKYDNSGNFVSSKKLLVDNETVINCEECNFVKISNNKFATLNKSGDKLHFYDNDFNFIETINLDGNYEKITLTDDGNYLLEGYDEIAKYDTSKNKIYGFNIQNLDAFNRIAHEDKSGNVVYSETNISEEENENGDWVSYFNGNITKYDTNGNILKKIEFNDRIISPVAKVDDKYILVGIKTDFNDPENMMNNYENKLYTINDNLEIINEQTINELSMYSSYAVNNENEIIFVGGAIDSDFSKISLIKSDSNGNIIWNSKDESFNLGEVYPGMEIFVDVNDKDEVRLSLEVEGEKESKYYVNEYKPRYYIDGYDRRYTKGEKVVLNSEDSKNINNLKITSKYNNKDVSNIISYDKENSSIIMPGYDISIASNTIDLPDIGDIGDIDDPDDVENSAPKPSSTKTTTKTTNSNTTKSTTKTTKYTKTSGQTTNNNSNIEETTSNEILTSTSDIKTTTIKAVETTETEDILKYIILGSVGIALLATGVIIYTTKRK